MKKMSLYIQITLVFLLAFIITCILVMAFVSLLLENNYEEIVFERLENENRTLRLTQDILSENQNGEIAFIKYSSENKTYLKSENIEAFIDNDSIKKLVYKASAQKDISHRYTNMIGDKEIHYVILKQQMLFDLRRYDVSIILTDDAMKNSMMTQTLSSILLACLIAFISGYFVVLFWIFKLVGDTKKVANSLMNISAENYRSEISTRRQDEIGDLVNSIEIMRNKIFQNEAQKQEIIQGVSHDLKTPIAIIQSYSEALDDGLCEPEEATMIIDRECKRLNKNVISLLDITRQGYIDQNQEIYKNIRLDLLIIKIVEPYQVRTKADIILDMQKCEFVGNEAGWRKIIENILDNAIRYVESKITIRLTSDRLEISNDGEKINEKNLNKIFKLYKVSKNGKTGIGLYIVKRTLKMFGYNITADNNNQGVVFSIFKA